MARLLGSLIGAGRDGPVVRRGATAAGRCFHDDHQGDRQLGFGPRCGRMRARGHVVPRQSGATRELLVNLRSPRAFVLQLIYVVFLAALVYFRWPTGEDGARQVSSGVAQRLFELFFLGQFFLVSLVAPTFAAGSITGEKERKTYEMLLASPLKPSTILLGKLLSSLSLPGDPDPVEPAADDPLLPARRHHALGDRPRLSRLDPRRRDLRPAEHRLLELLPPDELGPGGQLPGDPAAGGRSAWC